MPRNCIGVDVAKDWIDVFHPVDGAARLASDPGTLRAFARRVARERRLVVFEASGGYDRPLAEALRNVGAGYCRVNPGQARHFARALGVLGKTDRVDARLLAGRRVHDRNRRVRHGGDERAWNGQDGRQAKQRDLGPGQFAREFLDHGLPLFHGTA